MKTILNHSDSKFFSRQLFTITARKFLLIMIGCIVLMQAQGQADKRLVLADKYFAAGDFFTAAGLYQQFLTAVDTRKLPSDFPLNAKRNSEGRTGKYGNKTDILFRQAESYRLSNYWTEASALYKQCFEKERTP